jgi:hypothetical protein
VLNHRSVTHSTVTAIYDRYRYDKEKRAVLEKWAEVLSGIVDLKPAPTRRRREGLTARTSTSSSPTRPGARTRACTDGGPYAFCAIPYALCVNPAGGLRSSNASPDSRLMAAGPEAVIKVFATVPNETSDPVMGRSLSQASALVGSHLAPGTHSMR